MLNQKDLYAVLLTLAGFGALATDSTFSGGVTALAGPYAPKVLAALGVLAAVAAQILRVISVPSPSAGMQVAHIPDNTVAINVAKSNV